MIRKTSPLGRESMHFRDKMLKYHAEIEHMVYAAKRKELIRGRR